MVAAGVLVAAAALACAQPACARQAVRWGDLESGPFPVGFTLLPGTDPERSYRPKYDAQGSLRAAAQRQRPLPMAVWYPARPVAEPGPMRFGRYAELLGPPVSLAGSGRPRSEAESLLVAELRAAGFAEAAARGMARLPLAAQERVEPLAGPFPLVVLAQGLYFESPSAHVALCEDLASHGYVVVACPLFGTDAPLVQLDPADLETQVRDLECLLTRGRSLPGADPNRAALVGFDLGGMAAALAAMSSAEFDALVSLDSGIAFRYNLALLKTSPRYRPERLRVPVLHITRPRAENEALGLVEDPSLVDSAAWARWYVLRIPGIRHLDFTSYPLLAGLAAGGAGVAEDSAAARYEVVCTAVLEFLDAYLGRDPRGLAVLGGSLGCQAKLEPPAGALNGGSRRPPPPEGDFVRAVYEEGAGAAAQLFHQVQAAYPGYTQVREATFNELGYRFLYARGDTATAIAVFRLMVEAFPGSANAHDSLAEAYLRAGNRERARENYRKALELDPASPGAAAQLRQLEHP